MMHELNDQKVAIVDLCTDLQCGETNKNQAQITHVWISNPKASAIRWISEKS